MKKLKKEELPQKRPLLVDEIISKYPSAVRIILRELLLRLENLEINEDWLPTPENINALPEPIRKYIHDIETNCDPASMVQENALLRNTCKALEIKLEEKIQVHDELLIKYTEKFREDYERGFCSRNNYKGRLKQFSQEAGLEIVKK